jgi:hypothetical protein
MVGDLGLGVTSGLIDYRDEAVELVGCVFHHAGGASDYLRLYDPITAFSSLVSHWFFISPL